MIRIHADGSTLTSLHGVQTLLPALRRGWTDDIYATQPARGARQVRLRSCASDRRARPRAVPRSDLTGFNWANVPAILVETGFMTNARERRLLQSPAYQLKIARGLVRQGADGVLRGEAGFVKAS